MGIIKPYHCQSEGNGEDFECLYETEESCGENDDCSQCVCSWKTYGGRRLPKNWKKKLPWIICFILWGLPYTEFRCCENCKSWKNKICTHTYNGRKTENLFSCNDFLLKKKLRLSSVLKPLELCPMKHLSR